MPLRFAHNDETRFAPRVRAAQAGLVNCPLAKKAQVLKWVVTCMPFLESILVPDARRRGLESRCLLRTATLRRTGRKNSGFFGAGRLQRRLVFGWIPVDVVDDELIDRGFA